HGSPLPLPRADRIAAHDAGGAGLAVATAVVVSAVVAATVLLATWLPTRRTIRVEVRDALWREG
ncbi:MAG: hypothetical protein SGI84_08860, partial [Gemmatimonadota bacterium]|nr:hypothetical protein [Gemmatimonadota bacterium]